jgi:hypothetical protein
MTRPAHRPPLDLSRPVRTRGGDRVTILATGIRNEQPIVGLLHQEEGDEPHIWSLDGSFLRGPGRRPSPLDLINVDDEPLAPRLALRARLQNL